VVLAILAFGAGSDALAQSQLGVVTALAGTGRYRGTEELRIGQALDSTDTIETGANSFAGLFVVSDPSRVGFGGFSGEIVIEVDADTKVTLTKEQRTGAPVYVEVDRGRARAFFDPGRFKELIVLKTPLGEMQVTGSIIWVSHSAQAGSVFASEDSNAEIRITGQRIPISAGQKVELKPKAKPEVKRLTTQDMRSWDRVQAMWLPSAQLARARVALAKSRWEQEAGEIELPTEPVQEGEQANIPTQESALQGAGTALAAQGGVITSPVASPAQPSIRGRGASR
jgi:hypothetical protein